jgi:TonB family protein
MFVLASLAELYGFCNRWQAATLRPVGVLLAICIGFAGVALGQAQAMPAGETESSAGAPTQSAQESQTPPGNPTVAPRALGSLEVEYPKEATGEATVELLVLVDTQGRVADVQVARGEPPFSSAALAEAAGWLFVPAQRSGQAVAARIRVQVLFTPTIVEQQETRPEADATPEPVAQPIAPDVSGKTASIDVVVAGERTSGVRKLGRGEVRQMPGAFGDPFRAIEALPGVTPVASGLPYFYVRGAPPGNVGYFFDEVTVPLLYHVAAGPGVIHPAFIDNVNLYSGAYPSKYGRYAGGIVAGDVAQPEQRLRGEASLRLVDAGGFVEVPFAEGLGSAMFAGRYSYAGLVVSQLAPDVSLGYWDYQGRVSYALESGETVSVLGFGSHDFLAANNQAGERQQVLDVTFHKVNTRYTKELDERNSFSLMLALGLVGSEVGGDPDDSGEALDLATRSVGGRLDYSHRSSPKLLFRSGVDVDFSRFQVDINTANNDDNGNPISPGTPLPVEERALRAERKLLPFPGFPESVLDVLSTARRSGAQGTVDSRFLSRDDILSGVWIEGVWNTAGFVTVTPGLRFDLYDTGGQLAYAVEPRLAVRYDLHPRVSVTHDFGVAHQPPSVVVPVPGLGGAASAGLQRAVQSSAGVEVKMPLKLTSSLTVFQNATFNGTDVLSTAALQNSDARTNSFDDRTTNHSYGVEFYLKRALTAKLGGFFSYTLSRSLRSVGRVSAVAGFDRTHVFNAAMVYDLGRRWRLGSRVVLYSGIPAQVAYIEAIEDPVRTPWFYRLDWRLEKRWSIGSEGAWWAMVAEVLNTTLHKEVLQTSCYAYGCRNNAIGPVTIPSIGVEASF